jgi:membrane-bound serine protease (ClpP class)
MWKRVALVALVGPVGLTVAGGSARGADPPIVFQARLDNEAITPVTSRYVERTIRQAEQEGAACVLLVLDTPGGLVDSTREIVKSILGSRVPVVVYVAPSGARAASAGVFITLAGHVSAMAPGTNIGAAHPVQVGGLPGSPPQEPGDTTEEAPIEEKILNDTVAWARSLAELRGRNADWAARAVRESLSVPASEAVREGAVDLIAEDVTDLLVKLDGREVWLAGGPVRLRTAGAEVRSVEMWWGERLLGALANPNVALLLLLFGFYGILFELYSPGWGVAGTLGIVCLVLGFFALAVLPINYVGLALLAVALALFMAEVFVTSYGALTAAGVVCLILGGTMLVDSPAGFQRVSLSVLIPVALATAGITVFLVGSIVKTHRGRVQTGSQALVGTAAVAQQDFTRHGNYYAGLVQTHGELWKAVSPTPVAAGQMLEVRDRDGLTLRVLPPDRPVVAVAPAGPNQSPSQ